MSRLLKEIQEELAAEAWFKFFMRYASWFVGGVLIVIALTGGGLFWSHRVRINSESASDRYEEALRRVRAGHLKEAKTLLDDLKNNAGTPEGYRALSRVCLVGLAHQKALRTHDPDFIQAWADDIQALRQGMLAADRTVLADFLLVAQGYGALAFPRQLSVGAALSYLKTPRNPWRAFSHEESLLRAAYQKNISAAEKELRVIFSRPELSAAAERARFIAVALGISFADVMPAANNDVA